MSGQPRGTALTGAPATRRGGPSGSPRVLLMHGLSGSTAVWDAWAALMPDVELWDAVLPWTVDSDGTWSHDHDPGVWPRRALTAVPCGADVVVAHSFAATLLLAELTRGTTPAPRAVVLVAPFYRPVPASFDWEQISHYLNGFHRILEEGLRVGSGGRLGEEVRTLMAERVRERIGPYGWMRFFGSYLDTPFLDTAAVRVPVLVVGGEHDFAAPPSDARALAQALPDADIAVLPGCGHFPMAEDPGRFAELFTAFMAAHRRPTKQKTTQKMEIPT